MERRRFARLEMRSIVDGKLPSFYLFGHNVGSDAKRSGGVDAVEGEVAERGGRIGFDGDFLLVFSLGEKCHGRWVGSEE